MLAKILEEMWVEPEILEALSEEQKRILFFKMREEQVRRWREREEKEEERAARLSARPEKVPRKRVRWLQGRDGDVSVSVIGEENDFGSSRLLRNLLHDGLQSASMKGIQTVASLPEGEAHHHRHRRCRPDLQPPPTASNPTTPRQPSSEEEMSCDAAEGDPKDPTEGGDGESGSSADNLKAWIPVYRPHLSNHDNRPSLEPQLSDTEAPHPRDGVALLCQEERPAQPRETINNPGYTSLLQAPTSH
ncbi:SH2 domain-containing protein 4A-like [Lampris incognitus]|uniref:SH2 domain-containing protein 4A-like n=1 Tax=Lampris incognitus TaxID=2546036 RepID=UPI0024B497A3|nr:SH2 domain-containing protein 4A-like [Lampris incognitus]